MTLEAFAPNFIEHSINEGFSFLSPEGLGLDHEPARASSGRQSAMVAIMASGFAAALGGGPITGAMVGAGVGYSEALQNDVLVTNLKKMKEHCDMVAIKLSRGMSELRVLINADDFDLEKLVGRFGVIHNQAFNFREFGMTVRKSWLWGDTKLGTTVQCVVVFSNHARANVFLQHHADKCKHTPLTGNVCTFPWIVDLEQEKLTRILGSVVGFLTRDGDKISAQIFKKRRH